MVALLTVISLGLLKFSISMERNKVKLPSLPVPGHPFVSLEHVNINCGDWTEKLENFYYGVLGFAMDPRASAGLARTLAANGTMHGLEWANIGLQQLHIPFDQPMQRVRGYIGLSYPEVSGLSQKLVLSGFPMKVIEEGNIIETSCPIGNKFRIHRQAEQTWYGPAAVIDSKNPASECIALPGGPSLGTGMEYVELSVPVGIIDSISTFYEELFHVTPSINIIQDKNETSVLLRSCTILIGFQQRLVYVETTEPIESYDGHHIALYINDFEEVYLRAQAQHLNWDNPRFPQYSYLTLSDALLHNEFRVKDFRDSNTGEIVYELEHEIR